MSNMRPQAKIVVSNCNHMNTTMYAVQTAFQYKNGNWRNDERRVFERLQGAIDYALTHAREVHATTEIHTKDGVWTYPTPTFVAN